MACEKEKELQALKHDFSCLKSEYKAVRYKYVEALGDVVRLSRELDEKNAENHELKQDFQTLEKVLEKALNLSVIGCHKGISSNCSEWSEDHNCLDCWKEYALEELNKNV